MATTKKKLLTHERMLEQQGVQLNNILKILKKDYSSLSQTKIRDFKNFWRDVDFQQFISRYKWEGLPSYIPQNLIETMLYFRGTLCGFFKDGVLYFLPYAFSGGLNVYGYPTQVDAIAFNGESNFRKIKLNTYPNGKPNKDAQCVLLFDKAPLLGGTFCIPRVALNREIIDLMDETLNKSAINQTNSLKKGLVKVNNEAQATQTKKDINYQAQNDDPYIVINTTNMDYGENEVLNANIPNETPTYMQYLSALNNLRCYGSGIKNGGMFEKMERVVVGELSGNDYQINLILESGLTQRKEFLERLKEIYPEYKDVLDKVKVSINVSPYEDKAPNNAIEKSTNEGDKYDENI